MSRMRSNPPPGAAPEGLDAWLDGELPGLLPSGTPPTSPRYLSARSGRPHWRLRLASVPAVLGTKALVAAGAIALAGAGVGVKTAVTGSPSPLVWSRGAQTTVHACQTAATSPTGVGPCVSSAEAHPHASGSPPGFAHTGGGTSPPGQAISASHRASAQARQSAQGEGTSRPTPSPHPTPGHPSQS